MVSYFRRANEAGGCCNCAAQVTPCDGCGDCVEDVPCTLETRAWSGYGNKCGMWHPFSDARPPRLFRSVNVEMSVKWEVQDAVMSGDVEPGFYMSRCSLTAAITDCDEPHFAAVTFDSRRETNFWAGSPVLDGGERDVAVAIGGQLDTEPWVRTTKRNDCWGADEIFGRSEPGQPVRYSGGVVIAGLVTSDYDAKDVGSVIIPPPTLREKTATGEVWWRKGDSLGGEADGWGWSESTIYTVGESQILGVRRGSGRCIVTLENEHTTEELKDSVRATLVSGGWQPGVDCAYEDLNNYETYYEHRKVEFRFRYNYALRVRIGYKVFRFGQGAEAEIQYVDSPGERVFTIFPSPGLPMCVNLVSCSACL